jgi:NifU-like N terminal domain
MKLQIRVDDNGIISDVKFKTFGCGSAIASSSYMTERVKGLSLDDAGKIKNTEIAKELALPPVKLHCSSVYMPPFPVLTWLTIPSAGGGCHSLCYQRLSIEAITAPGNEAEGLH